MRVQAASTALLAVCLLHAQSKAPDPSANPAAALPEAPALVTCPAGGPLGAVDLKVRGGGAPLPFRTINHLSEGDTLLYAPVLHGKEKRPGDVALVLVPKLRHTGQADIIVTDPKPAGKPQEWKMTETISLAALVYGPAGLSKKKVANFLLQDEVLVAQLADYADKTAEAEQLVETLSNADSSAASVNAALNGFASEYGFAVQIDRNAPVAAQAQTVFATMNPQLATYNPLASASAERAGQTASMATTAASLFFGSPVGLAAGGTAMLLDLRAMAFPGTQFRASFAQPLKNSDVNLCGPTDPAPAHTRVAYLWASRIPNISAPSMHIGKANYLPADQKTPLPVDVPKADWKYLGRARAWALVNEQHKKTPVSVAILGNQKALEIDLTKAHVAPGDYKLTGFWDWVPMEAVGTVHVGPLSDFAKAHLDPASQGRLLAGSAKGPVTVTGGDFEFTTKVQLKKLNDEFATADDLRFLLPKGLREGPQEHMDVQIDPQSLDAGAYELLVSQQDGKAHPVKFQILANPPDISNLPVVVKRGGGQQHFVLKGKRLELLSKLEVSGALLRLDSPAQSGTERSVTVELKSSPSPGAELPIKAYLTDRPQPLSFDDGLQIAGPLPVIVSSKLTLPPGLAISLGSDEFPAGYTMNAVLDAKNLHRQSVLQLACADGLGAHASLHIGDQTGQTALQQLSSDQLFLAFNTSGLPAGCSFQAVIDNGSDGASRPFRLARILRVPEIDSFSSTDASPQNGTRLYRLTGQNLEMIAKLGWDATNGTEVTSLPAPLPGPGLRQSLAIALPGPPNPDADLSVWLRGDKEGRATNVKPPALPQTDATANPPAAVTVTSTPNPSYVGQPVTLVAQVSPAIATGMITFLDGQTALGTGALESGQASLTTSALPDGSLPITAVYSGDSEYAGSTSPALTLTVNKGVTAMSLSCAPDSTAAGAPVTFTAVVSVTSSNGGIPAGTVDFKAGDTTLGTAALDATGTATFTTSTLASGTYQVRAIYEGSAAYAGSASAAIPHQVR
ncbi:MAG TPA: Ig-like domain-containing protein [Bryobacteraceae bacterium]|nr:Ig-like domain-containing protein [Bryobacteraceae bacterium]